MKQLIISILFISLFSGLPEITEVRDSFKDAVGSETIVFQLKEKLKEVRKSDNKVLVAYKGAISTMSAKYIKGNAAKKESFKSGAELIEYAVAQAPDNVEVRFVRLTVQDNTPKFLKYKKNIEEDKAFLLAHYSEIKPTGLKKLISSYIAQSDLFSEEEKNSIQ